MSTEPSEDELLFQVVTPLDFSVSVSRRYWRLISTVKHPVMSGREVDAGNALLRPDEIRVSRTDQSVYLFYKLERVGRWICSVAKRLNGEGFLITAYPTDAIKEGVRVWPK